MRISVIIPTRNRPDVVKKALDTLCQQTLQPDEVIIVDASDVKDYGKTIKTAHPTLPITWIDAPASVCIQRNVGINAASGDWILLCDDDITLPPDYLSKLAVYASENIDCGAVAGRLMQVENNQWTDQYPVRNFADLLWRFIFQLPIWGDLAHIKGRIYNPALFFIRRFYRNRGNGFTLAGWPLITQWQTNVFQTAIYSLGANLIKREWLLQSPYDEVLDRSGIGDNYGVALGFPHKYSIHVLSTTAAYHERSVQNRLIKPIAYYRRVMALHYFIKKSGKFSNLTTLFFTWSLTGNAIMYFVKRDREMFKATKKSLLHTIKGNNPYWEAYLKKEKIVDIRY